MNEQIVFVYYKEDKLKVLNIEQSKLQHESLINDNWQHTATIDACVWIENLYNESNCPSDIVVGVTNLTQK